MPTELSLRPADRSAAAPLDAPVPEPAGRRLRLGFVLLLAAGMTLLFGAVIWPFIQALILAAIFAGLARPLHLWLARKLGGREVLASALTLLILCLVVAATAGGLPARGDEAGDHRRQSRRSRGFSRISAEAAPSTRTAGSCSASRR